MSLFKSVALKKSIGSFLAVLMLLTSFSVGISAFAADEPYDFGTCGSNIVWNYYEDGTLEFIGSGDMYNFDIAHGNEPMYYAYADGISFVDIGKGITSIGSDAFSGLVNLKQIDIPEGVITIGNRALSGCESLEIATIPESVLEIGDDAFLNCSSLSVINYSGLKEQWETIEKGSNDFSDIEIICKDFVCSHENTVKYDAVAPSCNKPGSTASEYCLDCEEWQIEAEEIPLLKHNYSDWQTLIESTCTFSGAKGRECSVCSATDVITLPVSHTDKDSNNVCDLCKDKIAVYTTYDYYNIFRKLAYNSSRFEDGEVAPDSLVHWYLQNSGDFKAYFNNETWSFTVPYDVYISFADKYFYKHSDMKAYITNENMWSDKTKKNVTWFAGGMGGPDDVVVLSVHSEGEKIIAQCAEVFLAYDDEYYDNLLEGYDYIYYNYSYEDENGELIEGTSKASVEGALELTLIDTDNGLKIAGYKNLDYYIVNGCLYNTVDDNFKVKYNSFSIDCSEKVILKSGERLLSDCFTSFKNNNNYWYEQGAGFGFTVEAAENVKVSVEFIDENGKRIIEPTSFGAYSIIPLGNAVLKIKTECVNDCEYEYTVIKNATCKTQGEELYSCKFCGDSYKKVIDKSNVHSFERTTTKATLSKNGKIEAKCTVCGEVNSTTIIYTPKTIKLSSSEVTYNGKTRSPSVTVKDSKGNALKNGADYELKAPSGRKLPGVYEYKVKFKGNYEGESTLKFTILPKAPTTITATQSTSVIKLAWSESKGATGYRVYQYSPSKGKYVQIASVKGVTSYRKATSLKAGTEYKFKIKPYTKLSDGTVLWGTASEAFATATECKAPKITSVNSPSKSKATVKWSNVDGETGYQLYYSTKKTSGFKKIDSYSANKLTGSKTFSSSASGKTIYFKVRAYKKVAGQTIYSEWSAVKSVKLK